MSDQIKIFVGTDRSQLLAAKVLEHSIRATTQKEVVVMTTEKLVIPNPKDIRQSQRTGFSFARWAIPELCDYKGRGIYLDADMLVFQDISSLWNIDMKGATIAILDGSDEKYCSSGVKLSKNETSVMVIDCEKAEWSLANLVGGLDGHYSYSQMMSDLCFLKEKSIIRNIKRQWNSMDYWDDSVALVHFTNVPTQPWVSVDNPYGHVWVDYLKKMIKESFLDIHYVEEEVALGYIRPSLLKEITGETSYDPFLPYANVLRKIDQEKKFIPHQEVQKWNEKRRQAIQRYELELAKKEGFKIYCKQFLKNRLSDINIKLRKTLGR